MSMARPSSKRLRATERRRGAARGSASGFTLVEVLVALLIVATTIAALQMVSSGTLKSAVETNRLRVAKMLLRLKAEEVISGVEAGTTGGFDGFPGYEWEAVQQVTSVTPDDGSGAQPESVVTVTITVHMPTMTPDADAVVNQDVASTEDGPGVVRLTVLVDPPDAELKAPGTGGQQQGGQQGGNNNPGGGGGGGG
jgi:prepilin-type N-terminal cleavage/methylation domain-containing protein